MLNKTNIEVERVSHLAEKIVIVDGLPGCGKSMFSYIIASLDRVELLTYAYEIELICQLYYLGKIESDAAVAMIRMLTDLRLYHAMMSRETNFRPTDVSSVFKDARPLRYFKRFFQKGDESVPGRIAREKPILHLTTHNLLAFSQPIFSALKDRVVFIEVVRHPLYMLKQQTLNMERLLSNARDMSIYYEYEGNHLPYYAFGWEDLFIRSNNVEKVIYFIDRLTTLAEATRQNLIEKYNAQILTMPFECFVTKPWPYMSEIERLLETKITVITRRIMKKQNVPRKMYSQGITLKAYKRCGWELPQNGSNEEREFEIRRKFAAKQASPEAMKVLDRLSMEYEEKYMGDTRNRGYQL